MGRRTTRTVDSGLYFDFSPLTADDEARTAMAAAVESMGIGDFGCPPRARRRPARARPHRPATVRSEPPTGLITVRGAVKQIAIRHDVHATFMPQAASEACRPGNGLHVYFELGDVDEVIRLHAIAGLLDHAPGFYRGCATRPVELGWRTARRRVGRAGVQRMVATQRERAGAGPAAARRTPRYRGAQSRPSLQPVPRTRGVGRSCGRFGSARARCPATRSRVRPMSYARSSAKSTGSARFRSRSPRQSRPSTPTSVMRGALGDHIYHAFRDAKLAEFERYRRVVHPWEHEQYLRTF